MISWYILLSDIGNFHSEIKLSKAKLLNNYWFRHSHKVKFLSHNCNQLYAVNITQNIKPMLRYFTHEIQMQQDQQHNQ